MSRIMCVKHWTQIVFPDTTLHFHLHTIIVQFPLAHMHISLYSYATSDAGSNALFAGDNVVEGNKYDFEWLMHKA